MWAVRIEPANLCKWMGLAVVVLEGVELPGPGSGIGLAVGADVVCGFKLGFELSFSFRCSVALRHQIVGIGKGFGVPFLTRRLVLLVRFPACTIELLAVAHVEIAAILSVGLPVELVDCCTCFDF